MSYEFKKLSEMELLDSVPENATVLAEVDGVIRRVPSDGLGGGSGEVSLPEFDLAVMGLPALTYSGEPVSVQCEADTSELCAALDAGPVKVSFQYAVTSDVTIPVSGVVSGLFMNDTYQAVFNGALDGGSLQIIFAITASTIGAIVMPLVTNADPPEFDLAEMGLPAVTMDGSSVSKTCDTTALRAALGRDRVKVSFSLNFMGNVISVSGIVAAMLIGNEYCVGFAGAQQGTPMLFNIYVSNVSISANVIMLAPATATA